VPLAIDCVYDAAHFGLTRGKEGETNLLNTSTQRMQSKDVIVCYSKSMGKNSLNSPFILAITGSAGSGKSTVAARLASRIEHCVNIEVDHVKHFIVNGFIYNRTSPEGIKQWELLGTNLGLLARSFTEADYNVVINGYLNQQEFEKLQEYVAFTHRVLLAPEVTVTARRDSARPEDKLLGFDAVKEHHNYFSDTRFYDDFTRIDSTSHSVEETTAEVMKMLGWSDREGS